MNVKATRKQRSSTGRNRAHLEDIREACIRAAVEGYESASISGLCAEGAFEAAISAVRMLDLEEVVRLKSDSDE